MHTKNDSWMKFLVGLQTSNKLLKVFCNHCNFVIPFLINMDDLWFTTRTALSIIEANHIVSSRGTIAEINTYWRVTPIL